MRKLLLILVPGLIALLAVACSEGEDIAATATPSSASPTVAAGVTPSVTPTVPASGTATPTDVPGPTPTSEWHLYTHPTAQFSFQYPANWSLEEYPGKSYVRIASFGLANWNSPNYPAGGILVDIGRLPVSQVGLRPTDAVDATLGVLSGWTRRPTNSGDAPWAKSVIIAAVSGNYEFSVAAAFEAADADEAVVQNIAATFALTN